MLSSSRQFSTPLRADQVVCPECGHIAECESIDVGVGLYISGNFSCDCGWESDADGKFNVASYEDYFVDLGRAA